MFQSILPHEFEWPQEDFNVSQLCKEIPSSEFQQFNDLMWLSSLEHVQPASSSALEQQAPGVLIPAEPESQLLTSQKFASPHADLFFYGKDKQLLSKPQNFANLLWPFTLEHNNQPHPTLPVTPFLPQAQYSLNQHSENQHHAHGSKYYAQNGAHHQIQSCPPFDSHKNRQGKFRKIENFGYF